MGGFFESLSAILAFRSTSGEFAISVFSYRQSLVSTFAAGSSSGWRFMTSFYADVIAKDARFTSLMRVADPALLEPVTRQLVERLINDARKMGIDVMIYETYRSRERQLALFNGGASKLRTVGVHHYGLACDIVRVVGDEPCWKGDFNFLGPLARSCGLIWGGDWGAPDIRHSFVDSVHVQRCTVARQGDLFAGAWYPDGIYNPYDDRPHILEGGRKLPSTAIARAGLKSTDGSDKKDKQA